SKLEPPPPPPPQKTKHRPPVYPGGRCAASGRELLFYGGLRIFGGLVEFGACLVGGQGAFFAVRGGLFPDVLQLLLQFLFLGILFRGFGGRRTGRNSPGRSGGLLCPAAGKHGKAKGQQKGERTQFHRWTPP